MFCSFQHPSPLQILLDLHLFSFLWAIVKCVVFLIMVYTWLFLVYRNAINLYIYFVSSDSANSLSSSRRILFILTQEHFFFIAFTEIEEGKRKSERNIDVREKHQLAAFSYVPRLGIKPTTWVCALTGNWTHDLSVYKMTFQLTEPHQPVGGFFFNSLGFPMYTYYLQIRTILFLPWKSL